MQSNSSSEGVNIKKIRKLEAFALLKDQQNSIFNNLGNGLNKDSLAKMDGLMTLHNESASNEVEKRSKGSSIKSKNERDTITAKFFEDPTMMAKFG